MERSTVPIPSHINDFLDWLEVEKGLANKSQENYERFLKKFLFWLKINKLENIKPHELTPRHVWQYRLFLSRQYLPRSKTPLKKSTQNYYLIALRSLLTYFASRDILALPSEKVSLPREKMEKTVSFLALDQITKLLTTPDVSTPIGLRDHAILETFFSTGLRVAELTALNREQIKINAQTQELEVSILGKGSHPRTIYFSSRAIDWLRKYLMTRQDDSKALFVNYKGNLRSRLTVRSIERIVKKYALMAGLPFTTSCHTLRHSFATDLLTKGVDLRIVQEFLGHRNVATTQIYTHVTKPQLKEIHRKYHLLKA